MPDLQGKVAIVTGASRGIGKGCALALGDAGAIVYVTGRTVEGARSDSPGTVGETADEVSRRGGRGVAVPCDHRDDAQVEALFARVANETGRLDILVNNAFSIPAELTSGKKFWEMSIAVWDEMTDVGLRSSYVASVLAARAMVPGGGGLIASVSSSGASRFAWTPAYGVGKCALDRLMADIAHELRPHNVACVSLWPGLVKTERNAAGGSGLQLDLSNAQSPEFTGRAVAALAADPNVMAKSGKAVPVHELSEEYGFFDIDGRRPGLWQRPEFARAD